MKRKNLLLTASASLALAVVAALGQAVQGPSLKDKALAAVMVNDKYGFIDKTGKLVISGLSDRGAIFSEGLAAIVPTVDATGRVNGRLRYIDPNGKLILTTTYESGEPFHEQMARVWSGGTKNGVY